MPGAIILANQPTGAGAGAAGVARNDLWLSQFVALSVTTLGNTSYQWVMLAMPPGSAASLSTPTAATSGFTPDVVGTYRIRLTTNGGGLGNVQTLVYRVRFDNAGVLANLGWAYPAFGEIDIEANYGGNQRGWAEDLDGILEDVRGGAATSVQKTLNVFDIAEWNEFPAPGTEDAQRYAVAWASDAIAFVALDFNTPSGAIYSEDGVEWLPGKLPTTAVTERWRAVAQGPGATICAVAQGVSSGFEVLTSTDAINWTSQTAASSGLGWNGIAWSPSLSLFVAVGNANGSGLNIMTSPDGIVWTHRLEPTGFTGTEVWTSIVWAPPSTAVPTGQFLAVSDGGTGRTMKSLNGTAWVQAGTVADTSAHCVAWNGTLFAVGTDSGVYTSTGAASWALQSSSTIFDTLHSFYTMVWAAELGLFVAGGDSSGEVAVSKDGTTWYSRITHAPGDNYPQGMAWSPTLRAFASGGDATSATMLVSRPPKALNPRETQWVTTNATSTDISLDFAHAKEMVVFGRVVVVATCKASGDHAAFEFRCVYLSDITNTLAGTLPVQLLFSQQTDPAWVCTLNRDAFSFVLTVQGVAATRIEWKALVEVVSHG